MTFTARLGMHALGRPGEKPSPSFLSQSSGWGCVHMRTHTHTYARVYADTRVLFHTGGHGRNTSTHVPAPTHTQVRTHTHISVHPCFPHMHASPHSCTCMNVHTHTHVCSFSSVHMHGHVCVCTRAHAHTRAHTHSLSAPLQYCSCLPLCCAESTSCFSSPPQIGTVMFVMATGSSPADWSSWWPVSNP